MKILSILLLATVLSARKLIPLTKEKIERIRERGFEVDENSREIIYEDDPSGFPKDFDARDKWPKCVHSIQDEGECLASWAFAASSSMSDRYCIATNNSFNATLSAQYLVSCATDQGGCKNHNLVTKLYDFLKNHGLPTEECVPYRSHNKTEGVCQANTCTNTTHKAPFEAKKCNRTNYIVGSEAIKHELYYSGPLYCTFDRYSDFDNYKSGIYYKVATDGNVRVEMHRAAKLIGWGVENDIHFWMLTNSWGDKWGENGNFRVRAGEVNVCEIAAACEPVVPKHTVTE